MSPMDFLYYCTGGGIVLVSVSMVIAALAIYQFIKHG